MTQVLDTIRGYCLVWGSPSEPMAEADGITFRETVSAEACRLPVKATANTMHALNTNFASMFWGSMRFLKDNHGLAVEIDIANDPLGRGVRQMLASGEWGMSVNFSELEREPAPAGGDGLPVRAATYCQLDHVSVCPIDVVAYSATAAWLSSTPADRMSPRVRRASRRWQLGRLADTASLNRATRPKAEPIDLFAGISAADLRAFEESNRTGLALLNRWRGQR